MVSSRRLEDSNPGISRRKPQDEEYAKGVEANRGFRDEFTLVALGFFLEDEKTYPVETTGSMGRVWYIYLLIYHKNQEKT